MRNAATRHPEFLPGGHPWVVRTPGVCGGRPRIKHSRIPVSVIAGFHRAGDSLETILETYPHIEPAAIRDAIGYYLDHQEEIDTEIEANSLESVLLETDAVLGRDGVIRFK
jgi:uncharacterized protein (DUF433 family)